MVYNIFQATTGCKPNSHEPAASLQGDLAPAPQDGAAWKKSFWKERASASNPSGAFSLTFLTSNATTRSWRPTSAPPQRLPAVRQTSMKHVSVKSATLAKFC